MGEISQTSVSMVTCKEMSLHLQTAKMEVLLNASTSHSVPSLINMLSEALLMFLYDNDG